MEIQHEKTFKEWIEKHIQSTHSKKYKFDLGRYDCLEFETKRLGLNTRNDMWKLEVDNIMKYSLDEYERIMASEGIVEIYTPIEIAYNMLKTIPVWVWSNPKVKLLNPCSKTGVFEYIAYCLFMEGLSDIIEDEDKRREHILNEQIFSIAMHWRFKEQITFMLTGKVSDKYERVISIKNYRCDIHEEGIYEMIERETGKIMQFDIIVGNPPYQEMTGGGDTTEVAMPLYHKFVSRAIDMKPKYISMIIPSRWTCGGKSVLDDFRSLMISEYKIKEINNYNVSNDIFDGVSIAGGVMYFLWDRDNTSKETVIHNNNKCSKVDLGKYRYVSKKGGGKDAYMVIIDSNVIGILDKVYKYGNMMDNNVLQYSPFGLVSNFKDSNNKTTDKNIKVICSRGRVTYTSREEISQNKNIIDRYKLVCAKVSPEGGSFNGGRYNVLSKPFIIGKNEVCSMTYLVLAYFNRIDEAERARKYIATKFVRGLILTTLSGMNITSRNYMFVPIQDFTNNSDIDWDKSIDEIDKQLYKKYSLTDDDINYIESTIKPMSI